jgi:hypothetical protein
MPNPPTARHRVSRHRLDAVTRRPGTILAVALAGCFAVNALTASPAPAAELAILTKSNWRQFAPRGKEVDAIYGDFILRNEHVIAVVAEAVPTRHANLTIDDAGGCLIDLTTRDRPNDQFGALFPAHDRTLKLVGARVDGKPAELDPAGKPLAGQSIELEFAAVAPENAQPAPDCRVVYRLADGDEGVAVTTHFKNAGDKPLTLPLVDAIRVDGDFKKSVDEVPSLFAAYDRHWKQAYALLPENKRVRIESRHDGHYGRPVLIYGEENDSRDLAPGAELTLTRRLFPAADEVAAKAKARRFVKQPLDNIELVVRDANGPVAGADVRFRRADKTYASARTDRRGRLAASLPPGNYEVRVRHHARGETTQPIDTAAADNWEFELPECGYVVGHITDAADQPIPCKIDFANPLPSLSETRNPANALPSFSATRSPSLGETRQQVAPNFGPDTAIFGVRNLVYTPDGRFRVEVRPGAYNVLVSHGPEYDAVFQDIVVKPGEETTLAVKLNRTVDAAGWISADFHAHSSPSGDNTSSQRGRVLNHLAEHIEFAPCTEHNRISTYLPHLKALGCVGRLATCSGIEVTGAMLPVNHQNAFPLVRHEHRQDGGGPSVDKDPVVQIERLAMWDDASDKLVQSNHPSIPQILFDRDLDGQPDQGFQKMFGFMDVMEVHPPEKIFQKAESLPLRRNDDEFGNRIFHWLQLLNLGYRIPGVVNTDAHYNFHGTGHLRNYIRSTTDDPAQVKVLDIVHAAEHGHITMTNGPFLEVTAAASPEGEVASAGGRGGEIAQVGDDLHAPTGAVHLHIRVQCPNWLDVNRVQIFTNGRPSPEHKFTRSSHPDMFARGPLKFDHNIPVQLKSDAHLIVAVAGEGAALGRVMGPDEGKAMPCAVANPIFVDVDGGGFQPNGDHLGLPLPPAAPHGHDHEHD